MFQGEAGFGRINKPKYCRCEKGKRPSVPCHHIRKNVADRFEKIQPLLDKPFINITMGTAKLHQCLYEKGNIYDGLKFYCCGYDFSADTHSPKEDSLYRDTLANLIGEELLYESETENHNYEFITINNVNVKLPKYKWFYEN